MATQNYNPRSPGQINILVSDEAAIRFGEKAADFTVRGTNLTYQLGIGDALMRLRRAAQREIGSNRIDGRDYAEAFNRLLARHPKLAAVNNNLRSDTLWLIEHWPDTQAYLEKLEQESPEKLQMLGARGLARHLKAILEPVGEGDDDGDLEPKPRKLTPKEKLAIHYAAHRLSGVTVDIASGGALMVTDWERFNNWLTVLKKHTAAHIAKLDVAEGDDESPF